MSSSKKVINESYENWRYFENKITESAIFSNFAYKQEDKQMQDLANSLPKGYELFLMTDHMKELDQFEFRSVAFINYNTKEIIFATSGTRLDFEAKMINDLYDDFLLATHEIPNKMKPAGQLNDIIIDSLGKDASEYKFHYTGHSLGGFMAEMQAADLDIKLRKKGLKTDENQISAITFENPGSKPLLEKIYEESGLPKDDFKKLNLIEFNNRKNIINSANAQAGQTYTIIPNSQENPEKTTIQLMCEFLANSLIEIAPMLSRVFTILAVQGNNFYLMQEHSMDNFNEVFVQKEGRIKDSKGEVVSFMEASTGLKPVKYDQQVANDVLDLKTANGNIGKQKFVMNNFDPKTEKLEKLIFSTEELKKALSTKGYRSEVNSFSKKSNKENFLKPEAQKIPTATEVLSSHNKSR